MRFVYSLVLVCWVTACFSQGNPARIYGRLPALAGTTQIMTGLHHFNSSVAFDARGDFNVVLAKADSGYYQLDTLTLYLQAGYGLNLDPATKFKGIGGPENTILAKLQTLVGSYLPLNGKYLSEKANFIEPDVFKRQSDGYRQAAQGLLNKPGLSAYFLRTQQKNIDYTTRCYTFLYLVVYGIDPAIQRKALAYMTTLKPGEIQQHIKQFMAMNDSAHVKKMAVPVRKALDSAVWRNFNMNDAEMLNCGNAYTDLLKFRIDQLTQLQQMRTGAAGGNVYGQKTDMVLKMVSDPVVQEYLLYDHALATIKSGGSADDVYQRYLSVAKDTVYRAEIQAAYEHRQQFAPGTMAPLFTYNDVHGKAVALNDLKGNYVYIDIWAQWCGPCKQEIPFLQGIETKYAGKPIRFVSLSVDNLKDAGKWKQYIADHQLGGIQLITDNAFRSGFIQQFNINSIPRFILIGPDGRIISEDADRPSNPNLQKLLDRLLIAK